MRIIQVLTTLSFGDAVGNDALAIMELLRKNGYEDTGIYAENLDQRIASIPGVHKINEMPSISDEDIIIYHLSTGTGLNRKIKEFNGRKLVIYHNVTPANFFEPYSEKSARLCAKGRSEVRSLNSTFEAGICDSDYNRRELVEMGYTCPFAVCPILIPFDDYKKTPDSTVISNYSDDVRNVVFVGRVVPNKKHEDLIALDYVYRKLYPEEKIRFIFVGSSNGSENYDKRLKEYAESLELDNVVFTGQVSFPAILGYYKVADVFACMSEHEGFCVPLVESMCFEKPIIAADFGAVADTLGGSGILLDSSKDMKKAAFYLHELLHDEELRNVVIEKQNERLKDFSYESVSALFMEQLNRFIRGEKL